MTFVWMPDYANGPKWIKRLLGVELVPVSYEVEVNRNIVKRHVDQLRLRTNSVRPEFDNTHISETDIPLPTPMSSPNEISTNDPSAEPGDHEGKSGPNNPGSTDAGSGQIESRSVAETHISYNT